MFFVDLLKQPLEPVVQAGGIWRAPVLPGPFLNAISLGSGNDLCSLTTV